MPFSGFDCASDVMFVDDSVGGRGCPLTGVGASDGTGFSKRSFDVVLTGGAGGTGVESNGIACVPLEG